MSGTNNESSPQGLDHVTISVQARDLLKRHMTEEQRLQNLEFQLAIRRGIIAENERELERCKLMFKETMTILRDAQSRQARLSLEFTPGGSIYNQVSTELYGIINRAINDLDKINHNQERANAMIKAQLKAILDE